MSWLARGCAKLQVLVSNVFGDSQNKLTPHTQSSDRLSPGVVISPLPSSKFLIAFRSLFLSEEPEI
jgi:hypothetical protein